MNDNREAVAAAMRALGSAWRGDWSDFDGRTLRAQLDDLARYLADDTEPVTYEELCVLNGVCPVSLSWGEYCDDRKGYSCAHIEAVQEANIAERARVAELSGKGLQPQ